MEEREIVQNAGTLPMSPPDGTSSASSDIGDIMVSDSLPHRGAIDLVATVSDLSQETQQADAIAIVSGSIATWGGGDAIDVCSRPVSPPEEFVDARAPTDWDKPILDGAPQVVIDLTSDSSSPMDIPDSVVDLTVDSVSP